MNKNKILVPTLGITGLATTVVPFTLSSCSYGDNGIIIENGITDNTNDSERVIKVGAINSSFCAPKDFYFGDFALDESLGEVPNFTFTVEVLGAQTPTWWPGTPEFENNFDASHRQSDRLHLYENEPSSWVKDWEIGEKHALNIEIKDADDGTIYYKNNGKIKDKAFYFEKVDHFVADETSSSARTQVVNGANDYYFGYFRLIESELVVPGFTVTMTINDIAQQHGGFNQFWFANNFVIREYDQLHFYVNDGCWDELISLWAAGEKHSLNIKVTDTNGTVYYENDGTNDTTAFYIKNNK